MAGCYYSLEKGPIYFSVYKSVGCSRWSNLLVVKLLQRRECVNPLLPHTFLRVRQNVWMNLEAEKRRRFRLREATLAPPKTKTVAFVFCQHNYTDKFNVSMSPSAPPCCLLFALTFSVATFNVSVKAGHLRDRFTVHCKSERGKHILL